MQVSDVRIEDIKPYSKNAKIHTERQIQAIANSIKQFGFRQPLVLDRNMNIIIGHGRLEAARLLGLETVPAVMATDLTAAQVKALRLADNKTNESEWDLNLLGKEIQGLDDFDLTDLGFNEAELLDIQVAMEPEPNEYVQYADTGAPVPPQDAREDASTLVPYPQQGVSKEDLSMYAAHAAEMVTKRIIIIYKDEDAAFLKQLLGVPEKSELGVIYLANNIMEALAGVHSK